MQNAKDNAYFDDNYGMFSNCASGQGSVGQWQGYLQLPNGAGQLRCILVVAGTELAPTAKFYSIDQSPKPITAPEVSISDSEIHFTIPAIHASYSGKLSAEKQTASGNFTQGAAVLPLVLKHVAPDAAWALPNQIEGNISSQAMNGPRVHEFGNRASLSMFR